MPARNALFLAGVGAALVAMAFAVRADTNEEALPDSIVSEWIELPSHRALIRETNEASTTLAPFTTDGCSGGMSSMWQIVAEKIPDFALSAGQTPPWEQCCVIHDRAYHNIAGAMTAQDSFSNRLAADVELRSCVTESADHHADRLAANYSVSADFVRAAFAQTAGAMFTSVRLGGGPCTALPWRWGYGYPNCIISFQDLGSE